MQSNPNFRTPRLLLASALMLGAVAAHADGAFTGSQSQEALVRVGMSMQQVKQAIGSPADVTGAANDPGPTWIYHVGPSLSGDTVFDVKFAPNGVVASTSEVDEDLSSSNP